MVGIGRRQLYREAGFRWGEAEALGDAGWSRALTGDYQQAIEDCKRALAMLDGLDHIESETAIADSLGYIYMQLGRFSEAVEWCQRSIDAHHLFGDRYNESVGRGLLGDIHLAAGDRAARQQALAILEDLDHPDAEEVRSKLEA